VKRVDCAQVVRHGCRGCKSALDGYDTDGTIFGHLDLINAIHV
jgi:hypothetical protein